MQLTKSKLKKIIVEELDKILEGDVVQGNFGNTRASLDQGEYSKPADVVPGNFSQAAKDDRESEVKEANYLLKGLIGNMLIDNNKLEADLSYYKERFPKYNKKVGLTNKDIQDYVDSAADFGKKIYVNKVVAFIRKHFLP